MATTRSLASIAAPPDALVLDATMPGMDGHEVFQRLRQEPASARSPSSSSRGAAPRSSRRTRASTFAIVTKPFDPTELVQIVREAIGVTG